MSENKTSKPALPAGRYLKYAIGEIVLVVIGILIALQINSWNGHRLQKIKEKEILVQIASNLEVNLTSIQERIDSEKRRIKNIDLIINHLNLKKPYSDSLGKAIKTVKFTENVTFVTTAFESLKYSGVDIISSDKLKGLIIELFNADYTYFKEFSERIGVVQYETLSTPFFIKYFYIEPDTGNVKVTDYQNLLEDQQFINMLSNRRMYKTAIISRIQQTQEKTRLLLNEIQKELEHSN